MILRKPPSDWDERVDVVVVGSGGAGSTAALKARADGAETLVFEKSPKISGTTAISGGGLWILDHELVVEEVGETDRETLESYIRRNVGDRVPGELIDAFLDTSVEAVDFIEDETGLEFRFAVHPEYHLDMAGAEPRGPSSNQQCSTRVASASGSSVSARVLSFRYHRHCGKYWIPAAKPTIPRRSTARRSRGRIHRNKVAFGRALITALYEAALSLGIEFRTNTLQGNSWSMTNGSSVWSRAATEPRTASPARVR